MQALKDLQRHYNWNPKITGAHARFIRSAAFLDAVKHAENDTAERVRLLIGLLNHVSLDPKNGHCVDDFVSPQGECISVWPLFYNFSNFFGPQTLPRRSPEAQALIQALQRNLDSRLFKAAKMHIRLRDKWAIRNYAISQRASAAFTAALAPYERTMVEEYHPRLDSISRRMEYSEGALAVAENAKRAVYQPAAERLSRRENAVARATISLGEHRDWYSALADFAVKYIMPASLHLASPEETA